MAELRGPYRESPCLLRVNDNKSGLGEHLQDLLLQRLSSRRETMRVQRPSYVTEWCEHEGECQHKRQRCGRWGKLHELVQSSFRPSLPFLFLLALLPSCSKRNIRSGFYLSLSLLLLPKFTLFSHPILQTDVESAFSHLLKHFHVPFLIPNFPPLYLNRKHDEHSI